MGQGEMGKNEDIQSGFLLLFKSVKNMLSTDLVDDNIQTYFLPNCSVRSGMG